MENKISKAQLTIEIPFEEYKELLIIKGKYEELKSQQNQTVMWEPQPLLREDPLITYKLRTTDPLPEETIKITC